MLPKGLNFLARILKDLRSFDTQANKNLYRPSISINMDPSSKKETYEETNDWDSAINQYEKKILETLYPQYPSSRKLAKRLGISHNTVAVKLRKYGIAT